MRELGRAARTKMQVRVKERLIEDIRDVAQIGLDGKEVHRKLE